MSFTNEILPIGERNTQIWKELTYFSNLVSYASLIGYKKFETKNSSFSC